MSVSELTYTISPSADSTLALEVSKTGLMRRKKHLLFFENFSGTFSYKTEEPESSHIQIVIDANSLVCRDTWLNAKKQKLVVDYVRNEALVADGHSKIYFSSRRITPKPLRGFVVEGELKICNVGRIVKVNLVLNERNKATLQLDRDATFRLSDFDIKPPSLLFGLAGTRDEALVRILLWAKPAG